MPVSLRLADQRDSAGHGQHQPRQVLDRGRIAPRQKRLIAAHPGAASASENEARPPHGRMVASENENYGYN